MILNVTELIRQIGAGHLMAISGLRYTPRYDKETGSRVIGLDLPVGHGYRVEIELAADDTYIVRRVFSRRPKGGGRYAAPVNYVKGERTGVYAGDIGKVARYAASYESYDENEWVHQA